MARAISVKVPTAAVIAQIQEAIKKIDADVATYPADYEKYEKETEAYKKKVAKFVSDYVSKNANKIGYDYTSDIRLNFGHSGRLELNFDADKIVGFPKRPEAPVKPNQNEWIGNKHLNRKEVLEQNLRILRMTTQEEVNASTYSSIIDLI
jgi:hypothetical protein